MRSLVAQFITPVLVTLLVSVAGAAYLNNLVALLIAGVVGIVIALALARRNVARLRVLRATRTGAFSDLDGMGGHHVTDEIDEAVQSVVRFSATFNDRVAALDQQLVQQAVVLDRMNDGLMRVGADGRIIYANVAAGTLFGGRNPAGRSFIGVTHDHELADALQRCLRTGEDQQHTFEIAGEGRLMSAVIIQLSSNPPESLVMLRDITEVNRLQNLRRDFVANVSHELRTPLSTIKILTETLLDMRPDDEEASRFLEKIDGEVDSMTALVRDLLDLTRLETMGGRLTLRRIDPGQMIDDVASRMRPLAERHDVQIGTVTAHPARDLVADERRLHQALINLVTNAIVHTPAGGRVTLEYAEAEDGRSVVLSVHDTGSGIQPDDLPRVWERFYKTDRARSGPGTGLGLAIVKHIVQAHGGTVDAESELGRGSRFRIVVPRRTDHVVTAARVAETYVTG